MSLLSPSLPESAGGSQTEAQTQLQSSSFPQRAAPAERTHFTPLNPPGKLPPEGAN